MGFDTKTESVSPDELTAGNFPVVTKPVTLILGTSYPRGAVLGIITASGKATLVDDAQGTGEEIAEGVLLDSVDATAADQSGIMALTGDFNGDALTFGGDDVVADHVDALRNKCVFIHKTAIAVQP